MTTKEQILKCFKDINHAYNDCTRYDTLKCMLDELQEPCEDAISRQGVAEVLFKYVRPGDDVGKRFVEFLLSQINALPSVTPQEPCEDAISREAAIRIAEQGQIQGYEWQFKELNRLPPVTPQPKSEWQQDHEILKAYSDGASAVLESIKCLIEQYEHYLELLDADMKDGSATIVTKTKYAVYTEVVEQLKELLESEDKA